MNEKLRSVKIAPNAFYIEIEFFHCWSYFNGFLMFLLDIIYIIRLSILSQTMTLEFNYNATFHSKDISISLESAK